MNLSRAKTLATALALGATLGVTLAAGLATPADARHRFSEGDLRIQHPWSRPGLPDRPAAAYLELINRSGSVEYKLISATSEAFGRIELHATYQDGDVMRMAPVNAVAVAPGEGVKLAPGGYHVMLFDAESPFERGDSFPMTLTFETYDNDTGDAGEVTVEVEVSVERGPRAPVSDHQGHLGIDHSDMETSGDMGGDGAEAGTEDMADGESAGDDGASGDGGDGDGNGGDGGDGGDGNSGDGEEATDSQ